jgi:hypothetical protein
MKKLIKAKSIAGALQEAQNGLELLYTMKVQYNEEETLSAIETIEKHIATAIEFLNLYVEDKGRAAANIQARYCGRGAPPSACAVI